MKENNRFEVNSTAIPNAMIDEVMPKIHPSSWVCYTVIVRQTKGWGKSSDWISKTQFMKKTGMSWNTIKTRCEVLEKLGLIKRKEIFRKGGSTFQYSVINKPNLGKLDKDKTVSKIDTVSTNETVSNSDKTVSNFDKTVSNFEPTKETITKETITKEKNLEPYGSNALTFFNFNNIKSIYSELKENGKKRKHYAHKDIAEAYNEVVIKSGKNLPLVVNTHKLSDKRMRNIRTLVNEFERRFGEDGAKVENLKGYFQSFIDKAPDFYFGDRGWKADFDYLLRITTLDKVIEGGL